MLHCVAHDKGWWLRRVMRPVMEALKKESQPIKNIRLASEEEGVCFLLIKA